MSTTTAHFKSDGQRCSCACHNHEMMIMHCLPCCSPPEKLVLSRDALVEWALKPYPDQEGLVIELSDSARFMMEMVLCRDGWSDPIAQPCRLLGLLVRPWDIDYPLPVIRLTRDGHVLRVAQLVAE